MSKKDPFFKTHLLEKSLQYAYKNCIPLVSTIELTHACNFKCSHCYNYDRQGPMPKETLDNLLSREEIFTVIDDLATLGALYVNFTGGEATASPHLIEYIHRVRSHHMEARIKSNGALITKQMAEELYDAGLAGADISLYGANNKTYRDFTDSPDSFDKAIQGIDNLKAAGVDLHVSIILHRNNIDELDEMINLCRDRQLLFQISIEVTDRYDSSQGARQNELTLEQYSELLSGPYKEFFNSKNTDKAVQCSCARSVCGISCTGDVFPCIGAPIESGNIKDKPLVEIWRSSTQLNKIRNLKREDFKSCTSCEYIESCNRSSGSIYINTGDYTGCEATVYKQAKIKHEIS